MFSFFGNKAKNIDKDILDKIEEDLILSDVGFEITNTIIETLNKTKIKSELTLADLKILISTILQQNILNKVAKNSFIIKDNPLIILVSGINGSGKTTTVAKLANLLKQKNMRVLLAPCDTFRAGAALQLKLWAEKIDVTVFWQEAIKDPSAVAYKALEHTVQEKYDALIIDTAGRLDDNATLMEELKKIANTLKKFNPTYPQESLLVLDATTGQTALNQAINFSNSIKITGIIMSKMDSQAKGGILLQIMTKLLIPIYFLGIGEKEQNLQSFDLAQYINKLLN